MAIKVNEIYQENSSGQRFIIFSVRKPSGKQSEKYRWVRRNGDAKQVFYYFEAQASKKNKILAMMDEYSFEDNFTKVA